MSVQRTMILVWVLALVALTLAAAMQFDRQTKLAESVSSTQKELQVGSTTVIADVADNPTLHAKGLSGREGLEEGTGMLFIFEEEGAQGIWMKDMQFSIDIIWLASDGEVITIASDVAPETYPKAFYADEPRAKYVLEVPAGFAAEAGLAEGDKVVLK